MFAYVLMCFLSLVDTITFVNIRGHIRDLNLSYLCAPLCVYVSMCLLTFNCWSEESGLLPKPFCNNQFLASCLVLIKTPSCFNPFMTGLYHIHQQRTRGILRIAKALVKNR